MDYSQVVFRLQQDAGVSAVTHASANHSGVSSVLENQRLQVNYAVVQLALLIAPSSILLLLCPIRLFQLRGSRLKVLPNRIGAIKAVSLVSGIPR